MKNPNAVALGRIGGRTTGPTKARDPKKMREAGKLGARKRWPQGGKSRWAKWRARRKRITRP